MNIKHQPATPLPWNWRTPTGANQMTDLQYAAHAANAYPKLVEALRNMNRIVGPTPMRSREDGEQFHAAMLLLRELGEVDGGRSPAHHSDL